MTRYGAGGIGAPSKDQCLRDSAEHHLLTGNLKKYCEIKVELNEWHDAVTVAPGVSLKYWKELNTRWINALIKENNHKVVPLAIATGNIELLLKFYKSQNLLDKAFLVAVAASEGLIKLTSPTEKIENEVERSNLNFEKLITENVQCRTERYLLSGSPVLAACCQLAVDNVKEAVQALIRGNELELAVALSMSLNFKGPELLCAITYISWRYAHNEEWELALNVLNLYPDNELQKLQICANCSLSLPERNELHQKAGLPPVDSCAEKAAHAQSSGNILEAVQYYLLSEDPKSGLDLGLQYVKDSLKLSSWKLDPLWQVLNSMSCVQSHVLQGNSCDRHRFELQIYNAYIGAFVAMRQGYEPIVGPLLLKSLSLIRQVHNLECSLSEEIVETTLNTWIASRKSSMNSMTDDQRAAYNEMYSHAFDNEPFGDLGVTIVSGSQLPRHSDQHKCYLRGTSIHGPIFFLEDCKSVISLNDALMWAKVNKFSPLGSGLVICPF